MTTTTAHGAKTAEIIATALRLNPGHEDDSSYRLKLIVWFRPNMKLSTWEQIVWWFKTHESNFRHETGVVSIGWVKKDHFIHGMAQLLAKHQCKLLEDEP